MKPRNLRTTVLSAAALAVLQTQAQAGFTITSRVDTTGTFSSVGAPFADAVTLNNAGKVAFRGTVGGVEGIYIAGGGAVSAVTTANEPEYDSFGFPTINNNDVVAFRGERFGDDGGIYTIAPGGARTTRFLYSTTPVESLNDVLSLSDSGWIVAQGTADAGTFGGSGIYVTSSPASAFAVVANNSGTLDIPTFNRFASVNDSGVVAFVADQDNNEAGVFTVPGAGGAVTTVAQTGAGTFENAFFAESASINNAGTVAFKADLGFDNGGAGIYTWGGGAPTAIISAELHPVQTLGGVVAMNNAGSVAFSATPDFGNSRGLYGGPGRDRDRVLVEGDPFLGSFVSRVSFAHESINDNGDIAFFYELINGVRGIAVASRSSALQWNAESGTWDNTSPLWLNDQTNLPANFSDGSEVVFGIQEFDATITIQPGGVTPGGNVRISNDDVASYTFVGSPIQGTAGLSKYGNGILTLASQNTYSGGTSIDAGTLITSVSGAVGSGAVLLQDTYWQISSVSQNHPRVIIPSTGTINVDAGLEFTVTQSIGGLQPICGAVGKDGPGRLIVPNLSVSELRVGEGEVRIVANGTPTGSSVIARLDISGTPGGWQAAFDVNDNTVLIRNGAGTLNITRLADQLRQGYAGGAWTGNGIRSTDAGSSSLSQRTALGYAKTSDLFTTFPRVVDGITINNGNQLLIRYTLPGDADMSRTVNIADFSRVAANFNAAGTFWTRGDFNYDGSTDIADFSLLAANFNQTLPAGLARGGVVPEPATASLLVAAAMLARRRR